MPLQGWMFFEGSFFFKNLCLTFNKCFHDNGKKTMLSLHFFSIIHLCLLSNFVLGCLPLCLAYNRSSISICEMNVWSTIGTSGRYTLLILLYYILQCGKHTLTYKVPWSLELLASPARQHCTAWSFSPNSTHKRFKRGPELLLSSSGFSFQPSPSPHSLFSPYIYKVPTIFQKREMKK